MKIIISLFASLIVMASQAQTNVYLAPFNSTAKSKSQCAVPTYFSSGVANFRAPGIQPTNTWFYTTTNILEISCATNSCVVAYAGDFGDGGCARGSIKWTNMFGSQNIYRFSVFLSNDIALPPNGTLVSLKTVGFYTNSP